MSRKINEFSVPEGTHVISDIDGVRFWLGSTEVGTGRLVISNLDVAWWDPEAGTGYAINYEDLMLHAISRNTDVFPHACIYVQLDCDPEAEDETSASEGRFVLPQDDLIQGLYDAICEGQELNSSPDDDDDDGASNPFSSLQGDGWVFSSSFMPDGVDAEADGDGDGMGDATGPVSVQELIERGVVVLNGEANNPGEEGEDGEEEGMFDDADE